METYRGRVESVADAMVLFEAVRVGRLAPLSRRLTPLERLAVGDGSVFVYDSESSGIKRVGAGGGCCGGVWAAT